MLSRGETMSRAKSVEILDAILLTFEVITMFVTVVVVFGLAFEAATIITNNQKSLLIGYLLFAGLNTVFFVGLLILLFRFLSSVRRDHEFFSKRQGGRILLAACLMLAKTALGLLAPVFDAGLSIPGIFESDKIQPILDLNSLAFSIALFAFFSVFEYGRFLQAESDDIL